MVEMFDEVFTEVGTEMGLVHWWDIFDSDAMDTVEERISARLGHDCCDEPEYLAWYREMAEEL